jgi:APA family basic amino acid/polyamine antiporter
VPRLGGVSSPAIAIFLLLVLSAINCVGIRQSTTVNVVLTAIEAGGLLLITGAATGTTGLPLPSRPIESWPGVFEAAAFVFFAYLGFEDIANVAEETVSPERLVPIAILLSVVVTAILYVGVALATLALASPEALAASSAPLADALAVVWGERGRQILSAIALFATANTVLLLIAGTRMLYGMARAGALPPILGQVSPATGTPGIAIAFQALAAVVILPVGGIGMLGSLASWAALTAFISVNAALLWLRRTQPDLHRPFRVPFNLGWVSLPALLGLLSALLASLYVTPQVIVVGLVATLIGLPIYEIARRHAADSEPGGREGP